MEPEFGEPVDEVKPFQRKISQEYWDKVRAYVEAHPGVWIPVLRPPVSKIRLRNIAYAMRLEAEDRATATQIGHIPICLRGINELSCRYSEGHIFFRWEAKS